jgi:aldehyde dehydrogenase (NAD+)
MARMASRTDTSLTPAVEHAPSSWGLGDGQAIPWEYAPAPEARDIVRLRERYGLFINGRDVASSDGETFVSIDPSTEQPLAAVARATPAYIARAVRAARRAQRRSWGALAGKERAKYLFRISRILQERSREFAVLESMDSGKPIKESRDVDVPLAASHFWYYAGWADKLDYAFPGRVAKPLGVAAQIIPWNFPLLMLSWKIAPALAAGNTVVLKPASTTPLSALLFADVCRQADLPPGVVNITPGPGEIGMVLATHPDVDRSPSRARPRSARRSTAAWPGPTRRLRSNSAARPPTSSSTTRRSTRPSRASSTASTSTRARCAAPARACSSRNRSPTR